MAEKRGTFGRMGFVLAAAGSAIGLGNIWKFPYITYENGGGSFVLVYLVAVLLIGIPIMLAEILIGRHTQLSPVGAMRQLGSKVRGGPLWSAVGWLSVIGGGTILSYYSVIAGWTVYYFLKCLNWSLTGTFDPDALGPQFGEFVSNGPLQVGFHAFFMAVTILVVSMGIRGGIERLVKTLMPILMGILFLLLFNSLFSPGFTEAMRFLFHVGDIEASNALEAVGHAFFTLSLGMGAMITYGSYVSRKESIPRAGLLVTLFDTLMGMSACVIMFSIIFSVPEEMRAATFSKSSSILFTTLPRSFYALPLGSVLAPLFYLLVSFAALTSTISILEVVASYLIDVRRWNRRRAALTAGGVIFAIGVACALSNGASESVAGLLDTLDYLASNWLLPVGGLFIAIFTGWFLDREMTLGELEEGHGRFKLYNVWRFLLRVVCPVAILWIIYAVIGGKSFA